MLDVYVFRVVFVSLCESCMMSYPVYTLMPTVVYTKHTNCSIVVILCMKCQEVRSVNCSIMRCTSVYSHLFHTVKCVKRSRVERVFNPTLRHTTLYQNIH